MPGAISPSVPAWRTPGIVVLAACLILLLSVGTRASFGLFLSPITREYGWSREEFAFALAMQNIIWGFSQPFLGAIADRYGTARVVVGSATLYVLGMCLAAFGGSLLLFNIGAGALIGAGIGGTSFGVVMAAAGRAGAPERRTLVFGIGTAASSLGQLTLTPLGQAFITAFGWHEALVLMAVLVALIVPLSVPLIGKPKEEKGEATSIGAAVGEALRHPGFLMLASGYFVCGFQIAFMTVHFPSYLVDKGLPPGTGAWAIATVGFFNIFGSFLAGWAGQKQRKKYLLAWIYILRAAAVTIYLLLPITIPSTIVFSAAMGFLWLSTVPLTTGLVGQIFGVRYLATLSGIVFFSHQIGSFLGVWLGGRLYDIYGTYDVVWWGGVALALFAAAINLPINDRTVVRPATASA